MAEATRQHVPGTVEGGGSCHREGGGQTLGVSWWLWSPGSCLWVQETLVSITFSCRLKLFELSFCHLQPTEFGLSPWKLIHVLNKHTQSISVCQALPAPETHTMKLTLFSWEVRCSAVGRTPGQTAPHSPVLSMREVCIKLMETSRNPRVGKDRTWRLEG